MKINGVFNKKWNIYVLFLTIVNVNFKITGVGMFVVV